MLDEEYQNEAEQICQHGKVLMVKAAGLIADEDGRVDAVTHAITLLAGYGELILMLKQIPDMAEDKDLWESLKRVFDEAGEEFFGDKTQNATLH